MSTELLLPVVPAQTAASSAPLELAVHPLDQPLDSAVLKFWTELFAQDSQANALQHPQFVLKECASLPSQHKPSLLLTVTREGVLQGSAVLIPKTISTKQAGALGPGWTLHGYRLSGGQLLQNADSESVEQKLLLALCAQLQAQRADFLMIEDLDQTSALWTRIHETLPTGFQLFAPHGYQPRLRIQFPSDGTDYWAQQFSSKTRSTFRRKLKRFGVTRLDRITRPDQVAQFLTQAHEISKQTWQSRRLGLRIRNDEQERVTLTALAEAGLLRSYVWFSNEEPAAFCLGNQAHGTFHYEEVGYATKFAKFSPGQMLVVQMIEDLLADNPPHLFDFGGGDADYKRMFANQTSSSGTVWITPESWKVRTALGWIRTSRGLKQSIRGMVTKLGLATKARQWLRYGGQATSAAGVAAPHESISEESPS